MSRVAVSAGKSEDRKGVYSECTAQIIADGLIGGGLKPVEHLAQTQQVLMIGLGQRQTAIQPFEQAHTQMCLQCFDLMADSGWGACPSSAAACLKLR